MGGTDVLTAFSLLRRGGEVGGKETGKGVGVGGCGREGIWAAQCHTREDCRENKRMGDVRRTSLSVCL